MAKLHATMDRERGQEVSTTANRSVNTMVETWEVRIKTVLEANGKYTVTVMDRKTGKIIQQISGQYPEESKK